MTLTWSDFSVIFEKVELDLRLGDIFAVSNKTWNHYQIEKAIFYISSRKIEFNRSRWQFMRQVKNNFAQVQRLCVTKFVFIPLHGYPYLKWTLFLCWYFLYLPLTAEISAICQKKVRANYLCDGAWFPVFLCKFIHWHLPHFCTMVYQYVHVTVCVCRGKGNNLACNIVMCKMVSIFISAFAHPSHAHVLFRYFEIKAYVCF